ncbi:putative transporter HI_0519 [Haemaphysalis longicornis]
MSLIVGVPDVDRGAVSQLIGLKTYVNEMVAYLELKKYSETGLISERSASIATFALAGFSNLSSLGIQLAAWSVWSQERLRHHPTLGLRALVAGILGDVMTACVAASMIPVPAEQEATAFDGSLFLDG